MSRILQIGRAGLHLGWGFVLLGMTLPASQRWRRNHLARHWCRKALDILGIEVVLEGELKAGMLHVANHISWLDVPVMMSQGCRGFVSKSEVAKWPMVGRLVRSVDTVFIERGAWQTEAARQEMCQRLSRGEGVLFFPEGTTSDGRRTRQFHARLFEAALVSGVAVQPLAIRYEVPGGDYDAVPYVDNVKFLDNLLAVMRQPCIKVYLTACAPIVVEGFDRKGLARESRDRIVAQLARHAAVNAHVSHAA